MYEITLLGNAIPEINYNVRTTTYGEEFDMVNRYLTYLKKLYCHLDKKKIAVFVEPQLETGYPDLVIVEYYDTHSLEIIPERYKLQMTDFKILFQIHAQKNTNINSLSNILGFSHDAVEKTIERLSACGLISISSHSKSIRNVKLSSYCGIKKIIAIEAKLDKWNEAIQQATKNMWFATESYILMNKTHCTDAIHQKCSENGIGIILVNGTIKTILKSQKREFPVSYSSFLFNEWIQKYNKLKG